MPRRLPPTDPAVRALRRVIRQIDTGNAIRISLPVPRDAAFGWKAAAVHPRQVLETEVQGIISDALHPARTIEQKLAIETVEMNRFYVFDAGAPRLLGGHAQDPNALGGFATGEDAARQAREYLSRARRAALDLTSPKKRLAYENLIARAVACAVNALDRLYPTVQLLSPLARWAVETRDALGNRQISTLQNDVIDALNAAQAGAGEDGVWTALRAWAAGAAPLVWIPLSRIQTALAFETVRRYLPAEWNTQQLEQARVLLGTLNPDNIGYVIDEIEATQQGVASVQMFYSIEEFYLYRLLVRYRLHGSQALTRDNITTTSSELTSLLNNNMPWLEDWIRDRIVQLGQRVCAIDPDNVRFYLKGGRAIAYFNGMPQTGKSDWDTQILLNPNMPPKEWYALFQRVTNEVLVALKQYKAEFYLLLATNAPGLIETLNCLPQVDIAPKPQPEAPEGEQPQPNFHDAIEGDADEDVAPGVADLPFVANVKAELIDVSIPRYDTWEAFERWREFVQPESIITAPDGVPYPWGIYNADDCLRMLREAAADTSPSPQKQGKRLARLLALLETPSVAQAIQKRSKPLMECLPQINGAVLDMNNGALRGCYLIQFAQFSRAYQLPSDAAFAAAFDAEFLPYTGAEMNPAGEPAAMLSAAIGNGHKISAIMRAHLSDVAAPYLTSLMDRLQLLCQSLTQRSRVNEPVPRLAQSLGSSTVPSVMVGQPTEPIFPSDAEYEIQLAAEGAYAAKLHCAYLHYPRPQDLDPCTRVSLGIFNGRRLPNADVNTVLAFCTAVKEMVGPAVDQFVASQQGRFFRDDDGMPSRIRLRSTATILLGSQAYSPIVFELIIHPQPRRPRLAVMWGMPGLNLRDLIFSYQDRAARNDELGTRLRMIRTIGALTDMDLRATLVPLYEDRAPPGPRLHSKL